MRGNLILFKYLRVSDTGVVAVSGGPSICFVGQSSSLLLLLLWIVGGLKRGNRKKRGKCLSMTLLLAGSLS
ncbi:hypothetical protein OPV22_026497 [Ensete ventricosum]|uniref:Transmembrane protein n=1 Tax=Ensete ventricosum TaxID=4639 RepID=A0AAV8Q6P8_ENSVE|nr:hypothetical protein OPV22_026497 [Ensete ventricosum]